MVKEVGIRRKRILCCGIVDDHILSSSYNVANDGLRQQQGRTGGQTSLVHRDGISARGRLCLNQELIALGTDKKTAFSAGVLDRRAHETVDEWFERHLARDRLRDFQYRGEI